MRTPLLLAVAATAGLSAGNLEQNVGIGVGTMIFKGQEGLLSQVCAATTNGIFMNQTFAITTGTLDAAPYEGFAGNTKVNEFVAENMDTLAIDIAAGEGQTLDALLEIANVPAADRAGAKSSLQANFGAIYAEDDVTNEVVVERIATTLQQA